MVRAKGSFDRNVFINCPFDARYHPLLQCLLFTVVYLGFTPKIALGRSDSAELRLDKITGLISQSRYSIHDLSRIQAARKGEYYRLNMPFEFGVDYGCRLWGQSRFRRKRCLILSRRPFEYMRAVSDLNGIDIKHHNEEAPELVREVRNWFVETAEVRNAPSASMVWYRFLDFLADFYIKRTAEGFSADDIEAMPVSEFVDYIVRWTTAELDNRSPAAAEGICVDPCNASGGRSGMDRPPLSGRAGPASPRAVTRSPAAAG